MARYIDWEEYTNSSPFQLLNFISVKDMHGALGFRNAIRYTADKDFQNKIDFLAKYCLKEKSFIITTGDVTNNQDEKKWPFKNYVKIKREFEKFKNNGIEFYSNKGNHDMFNGVISSKNKEETVFNELVKEKVIKNITDSPIGVGQHGSNVYIYGVDYQLDKETVELYLESINKVKQNVNDFICIVIHSHVTPTNLGATTDFEYTELIKKYPNIDMYLCGHYHMGFPTTSINENGKDYTFVNNWSFNRVVRDHYSLDGTHTPELEHVKIGVHTNGEIVLTSKTVTIPHKTFDEAFKPTTIDLMKKSKSEIFDFFEKVDFEKLPAGLSDNEILANVAKRKDYGPDIIQTALQYLNK